MIIDVHTHLNNYHEEKTADVHECLDKLHADMAANGIDYALILTSYIVNEHRPSIRQVVEATRRLTIQI